MYTYCHMYVYIYISIRISLGCIPYLRILEALGSLAERGVLRPGPSESQPRVHESRTLLEVRNSSD